MDITAESMVIGEERSVLHIHHLVKVLTINTYKKRRKIVIKINTHRKQKYQNIWPDLQEGNLDNFMK